MIKKGILFLLALLLFSSFIWTVSANPESFTINWWTVDGGGGQSTGGSYEIVGTAGQPDTGTMIGGSFRLNGGFWNAAGMVRSPGEIFLPVMYR